MKKIKLLLNFCLGCAFLVLFIAIDLQAVWMGLTGALLVAFTLVLRHAVTS